MPDLDEEMRADAPDATDQLAAIRDVVARRRALDREIKEAEDQVGTLTKERKTIELEVLPSLFAEARITSLGVDGDPAVDAKLQDFVHANIPASWPEEKRKEAFATLDRLNIGGLVRRTVSVSLSPGDPVWEKIVDYLEEQGFSVDVSLGVPWATLTASVRELVEAGRKPGQEDLDKIGAYVGKIVKLKERKE